MNCLLLQWSCFWLAIYFCSGITALLPSDMPKTNFFHWLTMAYFRLVKHVPGRSLLLRYAKCKIIPVLYIRKNMLN